MEGVGHAVLHHHAGGPCVCGDPPATAPKIHLLRIAWMGVLFSARPHGLHARPGHQGGGGGLAARGEMCMKGVTNLVGEAAEASLAGPTMLERVLPHPVEE